VYEKFIVQWSIFIDRYHNTGGKSRATIVHALWRRERGMSRVERERQAGEEERRD
jgi:hypothetical protein